MTGAVRRAESAREDELSVGEAGQRDDAARLPQRVRVERRRRSV